MAWFELRGDERLGRCATENCHQQPMYRLEAEGGASNYCSGCRAVIGINGGGPVYGRSPAVNKIASPTPPSDESPVGELAGSIILPRDTARQLLKAFYDYGVVIRHKADGQEADECRVCRTLPAHDLGMGCVISELESAIDDPACNAPTPRPERVTAAVDALDALVIHADAYLAGECSKAEFSEATERARAALSISSEGEGS